MTKFVITIETSEEVPTDLYELINLLHGAEDGAIDCEVVIGNDVVHSLSDCE